MRLSLLPLAALWLTACGSRSNLDLFDGAASAPGGAGGTGAGGSGTGSSSSSGTGGTGSGAGSSSGSGGQDACNDLVLLDPVITVATPGVARAPEIGLLPPVNDVFLSFIEAPPQSPGALRGGRMDPFTVWPPELTDLVLLDLDVLDYAAGPGPDGPVALIAYGSSDLSFLATTFVPQIDGTLIGMGSADVLFATAIPDRHLFAQRRQNPDYDVLHAGSYQPQGLPQSEEPLICTTTRLLGAAVPSGAGFVAAFTDASSQAESCNVQAPLPGTAVALMRYESPAAPGAMLERTEGSRIVVEDDPIATLALAPASFGAWVVFQREGSNARSAPPILAARVASTALLDTAADPLFVQVSPGGSVSPQLAVTAIGDTLAVAWVDHIDPSAPTIVIQLVRPDGTLGAAASISTNAAWQSGRIRLLPSVDGKSLVVAWESAFDEPRIGLARLDCLTGP